MNVQANTQANVREKFAFPVPSRPTTQQQNPPEVPPQAVALASDPVPLEVRQLRVANGSRRKRDLAAVRMAGELKALERMQGEVPVEVTRQLVRHLADAVPESTFAIWLEPLRPVGGDGTTLFLTAPDGIRTWVERRYSTLIREALQATGSGYTDVEFVSVGGQA